jgi:hypothetical protein
MDSTHETLRVRRTVARATGLREILGLIDSVV